jgi:ABC-type phosphonate transport system ATPase subunit
VTKCYGAIRAVDDVSFEVPRGEVLALLGTNGAGRTRAVPDRLRRRPAAACPGGGTPSARSSRGRIDTSSR